MSGLVDFIAFILPAYLANATPVILGGGPPLDMGRKFSDGSRILGDGKTIRGFVAGVAGGTLAAGVLALYYPLGFFQGAAAQLAAGFALSLGTLAGDAAGSFIKRRYGIEGGRPFFLDSVLFLFVALAFAYPFTSPRAYGPELLAFLVVLTLVLHPLTNFMANRAGLKNVPW